jgi:hypothetical protein
VKAITKEYGTKINEFQQIQEETKTHFEHILTEDGIANLNTQEDLLLNILTIVSQEDNAKINQEVT